MPVTNEARLARLNRAVEQRLQRLSTKTLQELTVKREINDSLDIVEQQWQRILAARQQVGIAGMNYDAELKQFKEGLRTMTEVLEMLTRLGDSQMKEIRAITDYQNALIDLSFATGTLLGYTNVSFSPTDFAPAQ
jgi:outer membrane protein TolC